MTKAARGRTTRREEGVSPSGGLHSLLAPVDLTPSSDRVLGRLARLPLVEGARVTLLHVVPGGLSAWEQERAERDANKALAEEARHLREQVPPNVHVEPLVRVGAAAREITVLATEVKADLVVVGRGGGRVLRDAFLGSTAERVLRQARRPVLVVRLAARRAYSHPALALDLDRTVHEVVRVMLRVVPPPRPLVEVIHAVEAPYQPLIYPSLREWEDEEWREEQCSKAAQELAGLLATAIKKAGVSPEDHPNWRTHVRYGPPRVVVARALSKAQPDLLVLGTQGHAGAAFVFLGTVAGDLLRAARCDVLVVPAGRASAAEGRG